jgi:hypothetical protein
MQRKRYQYLGFFCTGMLSAAVWVGAANRCLATLIDLTPAAGVVNSATSVTLSDLTSGKFTGITVGDKVFTGFTYDPIGDMPAGTAVNVLGFRDPQGNWGVTFHGSFIDLPGGGASDALLRFMVQVDPVNTRLGTRISDAHLFLDGVGAGTNSMFAIDETFLENSNALHTFYSTIGSGGQNLHDSTNFNPLLQKLNVTKDIFALAANDSNQVARATAFDQSFSQKVPEATTQILTLIGAALMTVFMRFGKSKVSVATK